MTKDLLPSTEKKYFVLGDLNFFKEICFKQAALRSILLSCPWHNSV